MKLNLLAYSDNDFALGYEVKHNNEDFVVLLNAHPVKEVIFELPKGKWDVLVDQDKAGIKSLSKVSGLITIQPSTGYVLKKR